MGCFELLAGRSCMLQSWTRHHVSRTKQNIPYHSKAHGLEELLLLRFHLSYLTRYFKKATPIPVALIH